MNLPWAKGPAAPRLSPQAGPCARFRRPTAGGMGVWYACCLWVVHSKKRRVCSGSPWGANPLSSHPPSYPLSPRPLRTPGSPTFLASTAISTRGRRALGTSTPWGEGREVLVLKIDETAGMSKDESSPDRVRRRGVWECGSVHVTHRRTRSVNRSSANVAARSPIAPLDRLASCALVEARKTC